ncbi:LysR substrate-binding domain-containing protein [Geminicoccus roseus]|uniref:LysR substrate-binding domain-containing protein n=1 Tax=Geminicoccus roseus TaxID=404900 RepID=UPI000423005D|nr:LysR substrate-binding domain-containing protein [Geminicoccus roseus]
MRNLNDLRCFVQVVAYGGFAPAARSLHVPKSTLSKRVAALEEELGARLIQRTSRSFVLTEAGHEFHEHARAALIEAEAAETVVRRRLAEPSGTVRLTASVPTAQFRLAALLPELAQNHPRLLLQVHATDRFVDLVQEGFDLAIRDHFASLPDSALVQRRLGSDPVLLVAARSYLERAGAPGSPQDLLAHDGLLTGPAATAWRLRSADGTEVEVAPRPRLVLDESILLLEAAAAGLGIACLPRSICLRRLDGGGLVQLLPAWTAGAVATTLVVPHRRGQLPAVRAVMGFLVERLGGDA